MKRKLLFQILLLYSISSFGQTVANQPPNLEKCQPDAMAGGSLFDLTLQTPIILGDQDPSQYTVTYYRQWGSGEGQIWDIDNPQMYSPMSDAPYSDIILAKVTNIADGTVAYTTFEVLDIYLRSVISDAIYCDGYHLPSLNIGHYYTEAGGPYGTGILLPEGTVLTEPIMLYVYAEYHNCIIEFNHYAKTNFYPFTDPLEPLKSCDLNTDGFAQFDLLSIIPEITEGTWGNNVVTFYETPEDAEQVVNAIASPEAYTNVTQFSQTIYVRKTDSSEEFSTCYSVTSMELVVQDCTDNQFSGTLTYDVNGNGCSEGSIPAKNSKVTYVNGDFEYVTFTDQQGNYSFENIPNGISSVTTADDNFNSAPLDYQITMPGVESDIDFCLTPQNPGTDVSIIMMPVNDARPGLGVNYQLFYHNLNTNVGNGTITFTFDDEKLDFINAFAPVVQSGNTLTFTYNDLLPFSLKSITLQFLVMTPPVVDLNSILDFTATITDAGNDLNLENNTDLLSQTVVNSYDPNDIMVREGEFITEAQADDYLNYAIRFQNMGTAEAIDIRVAAALDNNLDWSTFEPVSASHAYKANRKGKEIEFLFDDINLPFENENTGEVPESNGYIIYRIKPKASVTIGDSMSAQANIYFDFNDPITTNEVTTTVQNVAGINENSLDSFIVYPNPASGNVNLILSNTATSSFDVAVVDMLGKTIFNKRFEANRADLDIANLSKGVYFINITADGKQSTKKLIVK